MQHFAGRGNEVMANLWLFDSGRLRAASDPRRMMGKSGRRDMNDWNRLELETAIEPREGVLSLVGSGGFPADETEILVLEPGECLADEMELLWPVRGIAVLGDTICDEDSA
jgi:hypothetical protein